jgi:hypothetical protein
VRRKCGAKLCKKVYKIIDISRSVIKKQAVEHVS